MAVPDLYEGPGEVVRLMTGRTYGWMDDSYPWAITLHTTETGGLPGYRSNTITPKITVNPQTKKVYQHTVMGAWTGSLVGSSQVKKEIGVWLPMNQKSACVEIIAYSSKRLVDQYGGNRIWVGAFTDEHYEFLGDVVAYLMMIYGIPENLYAMPPGQSWTYGRDSEYRMAPDTWRDWSGLSAHGAIPGQVHWDTGVLDLHRIFALAIGDQVPPPIVPDPQPQEDSVLTILPTLKLYSGYTSKGQAHLRQDVRRMQTWLAVAGFIAANTFDSAHRPDGLFGPGTAAAVKAFQGARGITVDGICGESTWKELATA